MKTVITASTAPAAIGPYSHAVISNGFLFSSGQIGVDPDTGELVGPDAAAQTRQCLANLDAVLRAAGLGPEHVVRVNVHLADMADFPAMNQEYRKYFTDGFPARCCVAVGAMAVGARVEIDLVAALA